MRHADQGEAARLDGRDLRIGIVQARFNASLTDAIARANATEFGLAAGAAIVPDSQDALLRHRRPN